MTTIVMIYTAGAIVLIGVLAVWVLLLLNKVDDLKALAERWEEAYFESIQKQNDNGQMAYWAGLEKKTEDSEEVPHEVMHGIDKHLY